MGEPLLAVVEDPDGGTLVRGRVLEHGEDRRVAALHVRGATADHAQPIAVGAVLGPGRHRVEVSDERDGARAVRARAHDDGVAQPLDLRAGEGAAARLDEVGERGLLPRHARRRRRARASARRAARARARHQAETPKSRSASFSDVLRSVDSRALPDDQRAGHAEGAGREGAFAHARDHDRARRDAAAQLHGALARDVEHRGRCGQHDAGPEHDLALEVPALGQDDARAEEAAVLDDHRARAGRLEHAADADAAGDVDVAPDLRAGARRSPRCRSCVPEPTRAPMLT